MLIWRQVFSWIFFFCNWKFWWVSSRQNWKPWDLSVSSGCFFIWEECMNLRDNSNVVITGFPNQSHESHVKRKGLGSWYWPILTLGSLLIIHYDNHYKNVYKYNDSNCTRESVLQKYCCCKNNVGSSSKHKTRSEEKNRFLNIIFNLCRITFEIKGLQWF